MDKETKERVERPVPFAEFPKMKHHADGRTVTVNSGSEESALGGEWCNNPDQALSEKQKRDDAEAARLTAKIAEEAKAAETEGKKGKGKE